MFALHFTVLLLLVVNFGSCNYIVEIDVERNDGELPQFWKSTGFSPPDPKSDVYKFLLSEDERVNTALIGALPNNGIRQVRIHWLINLIRYVNGTYNFEYMDDFLEWLHFNNLRPGFELMGTPVGIKKEDVKNIYDFWYNLTYQIALRYVRRYGLREVKKWRFETWNEPDLKMYNTNNFTLNEFITYVTACRAGLSRGASDATNKSFTVSSADRTGVTDIGASAAMLKIGGPAGLFKRPLEKHPLCWGLLEFCNRTPERCPLQYISFHKKGGGSPDNVLREGLELLDEIHTDFPNLRNIPVANDEADILKTWSKSEEWRGDATYAAMVSSVIIDHFKEVVHKRNIKIEVLSNDNGFLNYHPFYFTQRTLLARFQMNETKPPHVQFVRKPVHSVMGLLSFLGGPSGRYIKDKSHPLIKAMASKETYSSTSHKESRVSIILTVCVGEAGGAGGGDGGCGNRTAIDINLKLKNLPQTEWKYAIYVLDNWKANPSRWWKNGGSPVFPDGELLRRMRSAQEPHRLQGPSRVNKKQILLTFSLQPPSVALVNVCSSGNRVQIGRPSRLFAIHVTRNEVLLVWKDNKVNTKCIKTYEVEYSESGATKGFRRINTEDTIFLSYHHVATGNATCKGHYRVRAVDYFDREGPHSKLMENSDRLVDSLTFRMKGPYRSKEQEALNLQSSKKSSQQRSSVGPKKRKKQLICNDCKKLNKMVKVCRKWIDDGHPPKLSKQESDTNMIL